MKNQTTETKALSPMPEAKLARQSQMAAISAAAAAKPVMVDAPALASDNAVVVADLSARLQKAKATSSDVVSDAEVIKDDAPVLVAQASTAQNNDNRGGAVMGSSAAAAASKDDKGAAAGKNDDDRGGIPLWGALGIGALLTAVGNTKASIDDDGSTGTVKESGVNVAGTPTDTDDLRSTDPDDKSDAWRPASGNASYGSYVVDDKGVWVYTLNNANASVQALNVGQTLTDTFVVITVDGTPKTVTITIQGSNDAAVIAAGGDTGTVVEAGFTVNGTPTAQGNLNCTDVDNPNDTWQTGTQNGSYGTLTMAANGQWTYTLDNQNASVDGLDKGEQLQDVFTVRTQDGTTETVTITIDGFTDLALNEANGTRLQDIQSGSVYKAFSNDTTPIASRLFDDGMEINLTELTGDTYQTVPLGNSGELPGDGKFTFVIGDYAGGNLTLLSGGADTSVVDIMLVWDKADSANADYGFVLENVASGSNFTVEGVTFHYEAGAITPVLPV